MVVGTIREDIQISVYILSWCLTKGVESIVSVSDHWQFISKIRTYTHPYCIF